MFQMRYPAIDGNRPDLMWVYNVEDDGVNCVVNWFCDKFVQFTENTQFAASNCKFASYLSKSRQFW